MESNSYHSTGDHPLVWGGAITTDNTTYVSPYTTTDWASTGAWVYPTISPTFTSENYRKFKDKLTQILKKQV